MVIIAIDIPIYYMAVEYNNDNKMKYLETNKIMKKKKIQFNKKKFFT